MKRLPIVLLQLLMLVPMLAPEIALAHGPTTTTPITVFAAASMKESLDEAGIAWTRSGGARVRISYAASSALARQIEAGAPADVFISADRDWMDELQSHALLAPGSRRDLLANSLVLIAPADSAVRAVSLQHSAELIGALGRNGKLALALTASVPAGRYARASLESLGAWTQVQPRVVEAENVRAALVLVARGEAALGIVYATDALADPRVRVVARFPASSHPPIVYPVARLASSRQPQAQAFAAWLHGRQARAIFTRHGFAPL